MKNPIFLGVSPWFLSFLSCERCATIDCALHPGFAKTNLLTSSLSLCNLANFCVPLPLVGGDMSLTSPSTHIKE